MARKWFGCAADLKSWIAWAETACVATCVIYYAFAGRRWKGYAIFCSAHANYRQLIWHIQVKVMQKRKKCFSENWVITFVHLRLPRRETHALYSVSTEISIFTLKKIQPIFCMCELTQHYSARKIIGCQIRDWGHQSGILPGGLSHSLVYVCVS